MLSFNGNITLNDATEYRKINIIMRSKRGILRFVRMCKQISGDLPALHSLEMSPGCHRQQANTPDTRWACVLVPIRPLAKIIFYISSMVICFTALTCVYFFIEKYCV